MNYEAGIAVLQLPLYHWFNNNCHYREFRLSKVLLHIALGTLTAPLSLYAMGLGDMRVSSALNQPFYAEIRLLDAGNHLIDNINVELASPEEYERAGFERSLAVSHLQFRLTKNAQGRTIVEVTSKKRLTEPYLDILVDLSWANGQLFKEYVVLLDPPDYALRTSTFCRVKASYSSYTYKPSLTLAKAESPVIQTVYAAATVPPDQLTKPLTYGPVAPEEGIWQIAQHYKIPELTLAQIVLAIVGMNPDAFNEGNLNGLKTGVKLIIPPANRVMKVPADLAPQEIAAHDLAWKDKTAINHVIAPPYYHDDFRSEIPPIKLQVSTQVPTASDDVFGSLGSEIQKIARVANISDNNPDWLPQEKPEVVPVNTSNENSQTLAALQSLQTSNALLNRQLADLQNHNRQLQEQLNKRDKEFAEIREQLKQLLIQRQAVAGQVHSTDKPESESSWLLWLLGIAALGGLAFAGWRNQVWLRECYEGLMAKFSNPGRKKFFDDVVSTEESPKTAPESMEERVEKNLPKPVEESIKPAESQPEPEPEIKIEEPPLHAQHEAPVENAPESASLIQVPTVLPEVIPPEEPSEFIRETEASTDSNDDDNMLEFEPGLYSGSETKVDVGAESPELPMDASAMPDEETLPKNNEALDTLFDLAKTYISMKDYEAAEQSLNEIIAFGNPEQKKNAEALLKTINTP